MLVWTGHGWIGAAIMVGSLVAGTQLFGKEHMFELGPLTLLTLASVVPCYLIGRRLNRSAPPAIFDYPRSVLDPTTHAARYQPPTGHTLAYIRLEYAGTLTCFVLLLMWLKRIGFFD